MAPDPPRFAVNVDQVSYDLPISDLVQIELISCFCGSALLTIVHTIAPVTAVRSSMCAMYLNTKEDTTTVSVKLCFCQTEGNKY